MCEDSNVLTGRSRCSLRADGIGGRASLGPQFNGPRLRVSPGTCCSEYTNAPPNRLWRVSERLTMDLGTWSHGIFRMPAGLTFDRAGTLREGHGAVKVAHQLKTSVTEGEGVNQKSGFCLSG